MLFTSAKSRFSHDTVHFSQILTQRYMLVEMAEFLSILFKLRIAGLLIKALELFAEASQCSEMITFLLKTHATYTCFKPLSHSAGMAPVHPGGGQPVYRDEPGHFS